MSRTGKHPVSIPAGVKVSLVEGVFSANGGKGSLKMNIHSSVQVHIADSLITIIPNDKKCSISKAMWGTTRSLIANMVLGVSEGYTKKITLVGVGYKASIKEGMIVLSIGYSHDIWYKLPESVTASVDKNTIITISSSNKQLVGEVTAGIKRLRKADPYKGKGIYEEGQYIRRKESKRKK